MFLLGLMGCLQTVFLPGFLAVRGLKLARGRWNTLVLSFALSLLINHLLVLVLVMLGAYRSGVLYALFAVECLLLGGLTGHDWFRPLELPGPRRLATVVRDRFARSSRPQRVQWLILTGVGLLVAGYAAAEIAHLGLIFTSWDAVVSWNAWAIEWSRGHMPVSTGYPQLLPCNISLSYVFLQSTEIWFFAKGIMFLFPLLLLVAFLALYEETGDLAWVLGTALTYWLLWVFIRFSELSSGYADAPVAFFALLPVAELVRAARCGDAAARNKHLLLGAVLAAAAALTKQMALLLACVYPLLAWLMVLRERVAGRELSLWRALRLAGMTALMIAVVAGPWWGFKLWQIRSGYDSSNIVNLATTVQHNRSPGERLSYARGLVLTNIPWPVALAALGVMAVSLRQRLCRWPMLLLALPYAVVWTLAFAYDARNLAMIAPLMGMGLGFGLVGLVPQLRSPPVDKRPMTSRPPATRLRGYHVLVGLVVAAVGLNSVFTSDVLMARQKRLQRDVGATEVDQRLYEFAATPGWSGQVLTDYWFLAWLPGLENRARFSLFNDRDTVEQELRLSQVGHVLLNQKQACGAVRAYLETERQAGRVRLDFQAGDYWLYTKMPAPAVTAAAPVGATR